MKNWNNKKVLKPEEVYGKENENLIDDSFIFYEDKTCLEMNDKYIAFYKLENPYSIDIPIYKWKKILHREDGAAVEFYEDNLKYYIVDGKLNKIKSDSIELIVDDWKFNFPVTFILNDLKTSVSGFNLYFTQILKPLNNKPSYIEYSNGEIVKEVYFNDEKIIIKEIEYRKDNIKFIRKNNNNNRYDSYNEIYEIDMNNNLLIKSIIRDNDIEVVDDYIQNIKSIKYYGKRPNIKIVMNTKNGKSEYFKDNTLDWEFKKISKFRFNLIKKLKYNGK
jgi:hypothetical protein